MKVLIVNGFTSSPEGNVLFGQFEKIVRESFGSLEFASLGKPTFVLRNITNIDDYLYDPNSYTSQNMEAKKLFDNVDFVFMDGDANLLPWMKAANKFGSLFKLCKRTNKCFFTGGFGFYMLVYYCATGYEDMRVINNQGRGSLLQDINNIPERVLRKLRSKDVFLDSSTGDFYSYNSESSQWVPMGNTGLHHFRTTSAFGGVMGRYIQNVAKYRANTTPKEVYSIYKSKQNEIICYVKKSCVQHYALQRVPREFIIGSKNAWDVHPINITKIENVEENYQALAECDRGPLMIEHKNTLSTQFHIERKFPETSIIIQNFVQKKIRDIHDRSKVDIPLDLAIEKEKRAVFEFNNPLRQKLKFKKKETTHHNQYSSISAPNHVEVKLFKKHKGYTKEFKYSGWNYSKRLSVLVVDNNATRGMAVRMSKTKAERLLQEKIDKMKKKAEDAQTSTAKSSFARPQTSNALLVPDNQALQTLSSINSPRTVLSSRGFQSGRQTANTFFSSLVSNNSEKSMNNLLGRSLYSSSSCRSLASHEKYRHELEYRENLIADTLQQEWSPKDIRHILHPELSDEYLPKSKLWIQGMRSYNSLFTDQSKIIKVKNKSNSPFCRFKQFKKMPQNNLDIPCVRISSPYSTMEERERKEINEQKKNWMAPSNFVSTTKSKENFIPNYVTRDPSNTPLNYRFRNVDKEKWVNTKGFLV